MLYEQAAYGAWGQGITLRSEVSVTIAPISMVTMHGYNRYGCQEDLFIYYLAYTVEHIWYRSLHLYNHACRHHGYDVIISGEVYVQDNVWIRVGTHTQA